MKFNHGGFASLLAALILICLPLSSGKVSSEELIGSLEGEVQVNQGKLTWSLPIELPSGANDMRPSLDIAYSPLQSNGILGLGFTLGGQSAITKCAATKEYDGYDKGVTYSAEDKFCLDGERLLIASDGSYHTAIESFTRVKPLLGNASWEVRTKDGFILEYGGSTSSRIRNNFTGDIYAWRLSSKRDRFGNKIEYTYDERVGENVNELSSIKWGVYELKIVYEDRPRQEIITSWQNGDVKELRKRVSRLNLMVNNNSFRYYKVEYAQVGVNQLSRVKRLSLCDANNICDRGTSLQWDERSLGVVDEKKIATGSPYSTFNLVDLNQDGLNDVCYLNAGIYNGRMGGLYCAMNNTAVALGSSDSEHTLSNISIGEFSQKIVFGDYANHPQSSGSLTFLDLNNDTYPDYCLQSSDNIQCGLNSGSPTSINFNGNYVWTTEFNRTQYLQYVDVNGDKLPDICEISESYVQCAYNNGSGFGSRQLMVGQGWPIKNGNGITNPTLGFIDIDGNGVTDVCGSRDDIYVCSINYGTKQHPGFAAQIPYAAPADFSNRNWRTELFVNSFRYGDLNADGLPDACWVRGGAVMCSINGGKGFNSEKAWANVIPMASWSLSQPDKMAESPSQNLAYSTFMLNDIDSDGRADYCVATPDYQFACKINLISKSDIDPTPIFGALQTYSPLRFNINAYQLDGMPNSSYPRALPLRFADMNGDGYTDICYRGYDGIACDFANSTEMGLLTDITSAYGNSTHITYGFLSDPTLYSHDGVKKVAERNSNPSQFINIEPNIRVVKSISTSNGVGGSNTILYHYAGLKYHKEKGIRSFAEIRQKSTANQQETVTNYYQSDEFNGRVSSTGIYLNDKALSYSSLGYSFAKSANGISLILPVSNYSSTYDYGSDITTKSQITKYADYDDYGNAKTITVETRGADNVEWNKKTTKTEYWNDANNWLLGKPLTVSVNHESNWVNYEPINRKTIFEYNLITGSLIKEVFEPNTQLELVSEFEYDRFGNKVKTKSSGFNGVANESRVVSAQYDTTYGLYLLSKTNALNQTEKYSEYNESCNKPTKYLDTNGRETAWVYDSLCQTVKELRPDGTSTTWSRERSVDYIVLPGEENYSVYAITEVASGSSPKKVWYDALGREVRSRTVSFDGKFVYQDKVYDALGRLEKSTLPYFSGENIGDYSHWVISYYDSFGRLKTVEKMGGEGRNYKTNYTYNGLTTTVTDPKDHVVRTTTDIQDRVVEVTQFNDSKVTYSYDAIGNLRETNANGQVTSIKYDSNGNKVAMNDPVMGEWQYRYNAFGELIWQKDAKGQETKVLYDSLGRVVSKVSKDNISTWSYDKGTNAVGRLVTEKNNSTEVSYNYDELGRPVSTVKVIAGQTFKTSIAYDAYSRPVRETYPDDFTIIRKYNANGYLQSISTPSANVQDYDFSVLEKNLVELKAAVVQANQLADSYYKDYRMAQEATLALYRYMDSVMVVNQQYSAEVVYYQELAQKLQAQADGYRRIAEQYYSLADSYGERYFDLAFEVYKKTNTYISLRYQTEFLGDRIVDLPAVHVGTLETITNIENFYNDMANQFMSLAASSQNEVNIANASAAKASNIAKGALERAEMFKSDAEAHYQTMQSKAAALKQARDRIADYQKSIDAINEILASEDTATTRVLWVATSYDVTNRIDGELAGNGLLTRRDYDVYSGHLRRITTGIQDQRNLVRDLSYTYDAVSNVTSITDMVAGKVNSFTYDGFDRLGKHLVSTFDKATNATTQESLQQYTYNVLGNMITKPDVGKLTYDPTNLTRLQRLTKADGTQKNYTYDANGNMLQAGDNVVTWTSDNQPLRIENRKTGTTAQFVYDANQQRVQQITGMVGKSETTTYVNAAFEVVYNDVGVNDRITQYKHHIYAGDTEVAMQVRTLKNNVKQPDEFRYLHADALGNIDTITDSHGAVLQRIAYSPFGTRRVTASNDPDYQAWTDRGFTGHEHLDGLGLIHMNARLYDPEIGRFLSPDTYIQAPYNSQNYNRYSYVLNNPLKYTDPSGHFFSSLLNLIEKIGSFLVSYAPTIAGIAVAAFLGPGATFLQAVMHGAAAGFVGGLVGSGSLRGALEGAFWGGITAGAAHGIGHGFGGGSSPSPFGAGKWLVHGIAQGTISELRGGNFQSGFVGAVAGSVAGGASGRVMNSFGTSNLGTSTTVTAIFGGLASKASGGSFEDGAVSAAFTYLFNDAAKRGQSSVHLLTARGVQFGISNVGKHSALLVSSTQGTILFDPAGGYVSSSFGRHGDIFETGEFDMDEYKAYHFNSDGDAVNILSRHISDADADSLYSYITRDLQEYGTFDVSGLVCSQWVSQVLTNAPTSAFHGWNSNGYTPGGLEEDFSKW